MAVTLTESTHPGDLYVDDQGRVHRIIGICKQPTVTMEETATGAQTGGCVGCRNLKDFTPISSLNEGELLDVVKRLSAEVRQCLDERIALKEQIVSLKEQMFELKFPEANEC